MWDAELHGGVALLTYSRPPDNVIGFADLAELDEALLRWAGDDRARVIVLTGGLPGYFIAHADLADVERLRAGATPGRMGQTCGSALAAGSRLFRNQSSRP